MNKTSLAMAITIATSFQAQAIINGEPVNYSDHPEIARTSYSGAYCTSTIVAHQWVLTADHCIEGNRTNGEIMLERGATLDKSWPVTVANKDYFFGRLSVEAKVGDPANNNGWVNFEEDRASSFTSKLVVDENTQPLYDRNLDLGRYETDPRNTDHAGNPLSNKALGANADVALIRMEDSPNITATGYFAEFSDIKLLGSAERPNGYTKHSNGDVQEVMMFGIGPENEQTDFAQSRLEVAYGAVWYPNDTKGDIANCERKDTDYGFKCISSDYSPSGFYTSDEDGIREGSVSYIAWNQNPSGDREEGNFVMTQGGNSGSGIRMKNQRTGDWDIFAVVASGTDTYYVEENAQYGENSHTDAMGDIGSFGYREADLKGGGWYWDDVYADLNAVRMHPEWNSNGKFGVRPTVVGTMTYPAFQKHILWEINALNSPKVQMLPKGIEVDVRFQNLSKNGVVDMESILQASGDVRIVNFSYEKKGANTACTAVEQFDSCVVTLISDNAEKGRVNMGFTGSNQPDQFMYINDQPLQGEWLEPPVVEPDEPTNPSSDGGSSGGSFGLFTLISMFGFGLIRKKR
ncbi:GlyGly-CTERM sorting domain-containing protein (plasmid) [Aliivibrio salmonicida]|uniref:trypsin-like serine protease n=1 Tax=Aliivibrio salmonicida TaxID=40269 RepID=UPI000F714F16|nr:trypsin-like serine protease [Aliivibrio salmonicida]AZL83315.1 GlyGly-CTERM sorting domain-containing protein [Aliivibrio salmonicida]